MKNSTQNTMILSGISYSKAGCGMALANVGGMLPPPTLTICQKR